MVLFMQLLPNGRQIALQAVSAKENKACHGGRLGSAFCRGSSNHICHEAADPICPLCAAISSGRSQARTRAT